MFASGLLFVLPGILDLSQYYRVEKKAGFKGKEFVCQLTTYSRVVHVASDKEHIQALFIFFLTAQTRLKENLER
jgi:hypothetical protein